MESNLLIEQYLLENKSSETASIAISNFLKTNLKSASPETMTLVHRCKHYQKHHKWLQDNFTKLKEYDLVENNGRIHHEK